MSATTFTRLLQTADKARLIESIVVVGAPVSDAIDSVLHWQIFAIIDNTKSVLFDLIPGGSDGRTGVLMITSKQGSYDGSAKATHRVAVSDGITVQQLFDLILRNGRDRYKYDDTGSGCRYWCTVVLGDLEAVGMIEAGSHKSFLQYVADQAAIAPAVFPMPVRQGQFY